MFCVLLVYYLFFYLCQRAFIVNRCPRETNSLPSGSTGWTSAPLAPWCSSVFPVFHIFRYNDTFWYDFKVYFSFGKSLFLVIKAPQFADQRRVIYSTTPLSSCFISSTAVSKSRRPARVGLYQWRHVAGDLFVTLTVCYRYHSWANRVIKPDPHRSLVHTCGSGTTVLENRVEGN